MRPWLDRDHLRQLAAERADREQAAWLIRAWLLAEQGPSAELRRLLSGDSEIDRAILDHASNAGGRPR